MIILIKTNIVISTQITTLPIPSVNIALVIVTTTIMMVAPPLITTLTIIPSTITNLLNLIIQRISIPTTITTTRFTFLDSGISKQD